MSIITTVYDRAECLRQCIRMVRRLAFRDCDHIIAADCPPPAVLAEFSKIVANEGDEQIEMISITAGSTTGESPGIRSAEKGGG